MPSLCTAAHAAGSVSLAIDLRTARIQTGNHSEMQATDWMSLCSHTPPSNNGKIILPQVVGQVDAWSWWTTKGVASSLSFGKSTTDRPNIVAVCITSSVEGKTNAWSTFRDGSAGRASECRGGLARLLGRGLSFSKWGELSRESSAQPHRTP